MSVTLDQIKAALPEAGLHDGGWRYSPEPLTLTSQEQKFLDGLGHPLARFQRTCDELYRRSANGSIEPWLAELLDTGKPTWMVDVQREAGRLGQHPQVIRPDLLLTEDGMALTELDGVPGGIGTTAWLSSVYADAGFPILGGERGMIDGFSSVLEKDGVVVISEEAADYRREMEWLVARAGGNRQVVNAESFTPDERMVYRFFEWFDWESLPLFRRMAEDSVRGKLRLTSPCLPHLEDKLWLALLWTPALRNLWQDSMRGSHLKRLQQLVPFSWVVDPSPLPPQAALPRLDVHDWSEVKDFSQRDRQLVLKISGFHETAWGSRGVFIGHDLPKNEWAEHLQRAMDEFEQQPWVMQQYHETRLVEHPVFRDDGSVETLRGRVRLCPYYFTDASGHTSLGGCLATIAPADKKKIHGMRDAVLVPCTVDGSSHKNQLSAKA